MTRNAYAVTGTAWVDRTATDRRYRAALRLATIHALRNARRLGYQPLGDTVVWQIHYVGPAETCIHATIIAGPNPRILAAPHN